MANTETITKSAAEPERAPGPNPGVISLSVNSKAALYAIYMPYLKRGGIFVPTAKPYALGDEVFVLLSLAMKEAEEKFTIAGTVAWITPAGAQNSKTQGIGVQFREDESGQVAKHKIETILVGYPSARQTHTL